MRYLTLATDYDGTIAHHGKLDEPTLEALERLKKSGRKLILVTGRELDELMEVCPSIDRFDRVVAENGALLYDPAEKRERLLGPAPDPEFVARLEARGAERVSVGRVIVATWEPHQHAALEAIHELGLELQVIFNKGAVMILPTGINKATGLSAALEELGLSPHNVVGVGDAENDHAFLAMCECSAAVANALEAVKERADLVLNQDHGAGVAELIDAILVDDLAAVAPRLERHQIALGHQLETEEPVSLPPYGVNVMVAGTSGSGKSTLTMGLLERLAGAGYQYVVIDPEGDYSGLEGATALGEPQRAPVADEVMALVAQPGQNVVVNLLGIPLEHRPGFFSGLLSRLQVMRVKYGRPHWMVVDEAHHLLPAAWDPATQALPLETTGLLLITVHPESVAPAVLGSVSTLLAVGSTPGETLRNFADAVGTTAPEVDGSPLEAGELLRFDRESGAAFRLRSIPPRSEHNRHSRKYAEGHVGPDRTFRFRGPEGKLDLRAQNLVVFLQMAAGVDDVTWLYHLKRGEYSEWFRSVIKDQELADEVGEIERQADALDPQASREQVRASVDRRYTLPADAPTGAVDAEAPAKA